ncbi:MAG: class I SAM-dependent methyltransferase [Vicinamibacteria bacterium]
MKWPEPEPFSMRALDLYKDQSRGVRLHTRLRAFSAPLKAVVAAIPPQGSLLDVGCGHGLIANEVALRNPGARVLGIDLSETKIASARASVGSRTNVEFRLAPLEGVAEGGFGAVSLIDVLYLVPAASWERFLRTCFERLAPGGRFILKEIGTKPRWKFERLKLQEFVSTRILRITKGDTMHFENGDGLRQRLLGIGFEEVGVETLDRGYTSPHILLTARRPLW